MLFISSLDYAFFLHSFVSDNYIQIKPAMSTNKMSQDAKKEEFKKYLEKAGVLEVLTKSLVSLYEEPDKPGDAVNYLKKTVGGTENDRAEIERLQSENSELKSKVSSRDK